MWAKSRNWSYEIKKKSIKKYFIKNTAWIKDQNKSICAHIWMSMRYEMKKIKSNKYNSYICAYSLVYDPWERCIHMGRKCLTLPLCTFTDFFKQTGITFKFEKPRTEKIWSINDIMSLSTWSTWIYLSLRHTLVLIKWIINVSCS